MDSSHADQIIRLLGDISQTIAKGLGASVAGPTFTFPTFVTSVAGRSGAVTLTYLDIGGLGGAAVLNVGTTAGTVAAGDDSRFSGGGGGVWTRDAAHSSVTPTTPSDSVWVGANAKDFYGQSNAVDVLISGNNTAKGDPGGRFIGLACGDPGGVFYKTELYADADSGAIILGRNNVTRIVLATTNTDVTSFSLSNDLGGVAEISNSSTNGPKISLGGLILFASAPADGVPVATFNSSVAHTIGHLIDVFNNGVEILSVDYVGAIRIGPNVADFYSDNNPVDVLLSAANTAKGDATGRFIGLACGDPGGVFYKTELWADANSARYQLFFQNTTVAQMVASSAGGALGLRGSGGTSGVSLAPTNGATSICFFFCTGGETHTANQIFSVQNNTTEVFSIFFDGAITAGDPGSGSGRWLLGNVQTGVVALNTANYIEVSVGGVVQKLLIAV